MRHMKGLQGVCVHADPDIIIVELAGQYYYQLEDDGPMIFMAGDQKKKIIKPEVPDYQDERPTSDSGIDILV